MSHNTLPTVAELSGEMRECLAKVKYVFTDLDATMLAPGSCVLRDNDGNPSTKLVEAVVALARAGIQVVPTSGRNRGNAGFSDEERESFTRLLEAGFTDTFRYLYPDLTGAYSWWSYRFNARKNNAGWRIDYFLVSNDLREQVRQARIHGDIFGSDHCPVELELNLEAGSPNETT